MLGILLPISLIAIMLAVYSVRGRQKDFLRESVLIGFVLWGSCVIAATETLSLFKAIGFVQVLVFWVVAVAVCAGIMIKHAGTGLDRMAPDSPWPFWEKVLFNRIIFFTLCLGLIALLSPPNTYDALSYHLSRVMHWIQDRSVAYYPTNISLQLIYPAFAEYVVLHFQLLSGGDHWANFVQYLSMAGSLVGVSLIARELRATVRGQVIAAFIAMTLPMGILQATSTQTDYVDTLWLCSFVYFFFCWRRTLWGGYALLAGASLGLDLATKGVVLIYAWPFAVWMAVTALHRLQIKKSCITAAGIIGIALLYYMGTLCRNMGFYHGHAGQFTSVNDSLLNTRIGWEGFAANLLRNAGLHLITPWLDVNAAIAQWIYNIASFLHVDLNNKDWSFCGAAFQKIDFRGNEDYLGNPMHLLLYGVVLVLFAVFKRFRNRDTVYYLAACALGWISFDLMLKWQPYHSRFHLGAFVLFAPLAGFVLERVKARWMVSGIMGAFFVSAWLIVLIDVNKPILNSVSIFHPQDRDFIHFIRVESPQTVYMEDETIAAALKKMGCRNVGLIMGQGELEYLWWVVLNPSADPSMRIESIFVNNASAALAYPRGDFVPDAVISINDDRAWFNWGSTSYRAVWHNEAAGKKISILVKGPA